MKSSSRPFGLRTTDIRFPVGVREGTCSAFSSSNKGSHTPLATAPAPKMSIRFGLTVACIAASNPILLLIIANECQTGSAKLELVTALYFPESRVSSRRGVSPSRGAQPSGTKEQVSRKGTQDMQ